MGAKINFIKQSYVIQHELPALSVVLSRSEFLNGKAQYCYDAHELKYHLIDFWGQHREVTTLFYAVNFEGLDVILGMSMLIDNSIILDPAAASWRFNVNSFKLTIEGSKNFAKSLQKKSAVFALICADVDEPAQDNIQVLKVSKQVKNFKPTFDDKMAEILADDKGAHHAIDLIEGKEPPFMFLYNLFQKKLTELRRYIEDALAKEWIKHFVSLVDVSVLFVSKKDGELRLCVDYRGLNAITIKNRHSLPLITEILDRLCEFKCFTKLNFKDVYYRIRIKVGDEWKTAFRTRYDHFEYQIMPFGLVNVSAIFQAYINKALRGFIDVICVVYLNDILIYSSDSAHHWRDVRKVLERLRDYQLYVNLKKCRFVITEVEFLGFIVFTKKVRMNEKRVRIIKEWFKSTTYRELQVFLNFVNFYRRFIHRYSKIAEPLISLLKNSKVEKKSGSFEWPESAKLAFRHLCDIFIFTSLFCHYNSKKKVRMKTDSFNFAIAGTLSQQNDDGNWRSMTFMSRKMISAEQNYETHDQKLLAIVQAFKAWRHYLKNSSKTIEVWSDHNNLREFMKQKKLNFRQARWALTLAAYDFEIFHRFDKTNSTDEPSRRFDYEEISSLNTRLLLTLQNKLTLSSPEIEISMAQSRRKMSDLTFESSVYTSDAVRAVRDETPSQSIKEQIQINLASMFQLAGVAVVISRKNVRVISKKPYEESQRSMKSLIKKLQANDTWTKKFCSKKSALPRRRRRSKAWTVDFEGLVRHNGRLYVSEDAAVRKELISKNHDDSLAGYFGPDKTFELLQRKYYWAGCGKQAGEYVKICDICQRIKASRHKPYDELSFLSISKNFWKEITWNFITGLSSSKRKGIVYDFIFVIMNRCTKMVKYISTIVKCDSAELAEIFFEKIVLNFGMSIDIVSDRGSIFTSAFWSALCYHSKIKRRLSIAFHSQTNGLIERQNQVFEQYLRTFVDAEQAQWANHLSLTEFVYNNAKHSFIEEFSFFLMYGYHSKIHYEVENNFTVKGMPEAKNRIRRLHEMRNLLTQRLEHAVAQQAKYYNRKHKSMSFAVDDLIMLFTKNLKQKKLSKKLSHKFAEPFRIKNKIESQTYRLTLFNTYRIHNTFHVSLLKKYHHRADAKETKSMLMASKLIDDEEQWEIEKIFDKKGDRKGVWYKIKWTGWGSEYNQWLSKKEFDRTSSLIRKFNDERTTKRRRKNK